MQRRRSSVEEGAFFFDAVVTNGPPGIRGKVVSMMDSRLFQQTLFCAAIVDTTCLAVAGSGIGCDLATTAGSAATMECGAYHRDLALVAMVVSAVFALHLLLDVTCRGLVETLTTTHRALGVLILLSTIPDLYLKGNVHFNGVPLLSNSLQWLRHVQWLQCARAMRLITTSKTQLKLFKSLWESRIPIFTTLAIVFGLVFVLGIMAVQLLGGKMNYCSDGHMLALSDCTGIDPNSNQLREWRRRFFHYDDIFNSMMTLFVVSTKDRWVMLMWQAADAQERNIGPKQNVNPGFVLFFVFAVFVGGFFTLNIFSGVFMASHKAALTSDGEKHLFSRKKARSMSQPVYSRLRRFAWALVNDLYFDVIMLVVIALDVLSMATQSGKPSNIQAELGAILNFTFTYVYGMEAFLKLFAQYPGQYFSSVWNFFEFVIVLISYGAIGIDFSLQAVLSPTVIRSVRLVRLVRVIRSFRIFNFKALSRLRQLIEALIHAARSFLTVFMLLGITYIIFALFSVPVFGHLCSVYQRDSNTIGLLQQTGVLDRCALISSIDLLPKTSTFSTFPSAFLSLLRINNLDEWSLVLQQLSLTHDERPSGENATVVATEHLRNFLLSGDTLDLRLARGELPGCQTTEELHALGEIVGCFVGADAPFGCETTCGPGKGAAFAFCAVFLILSAYIILNLVLVVLMQRFQEEHAILERKGTVSLSVLLNTSKVIHRWKSDVLVPEVKSFRARRHTSVHRYYA